MLLLLSLFLSLPASAEDVKEIRVINPGGFTQVGETMVRCEAFHVPQENRCICTKGYMSRTYVGCATFLTKFNRWKEVEMQWMLWTNSDLHRNGPLPNCDQENQALVAKKMAECEEMRLKDPRCVSR